MSDRYDRRALRRSPGEISRPPSPGDLKNAGRQYGVKGRCAGVAHVTSRRHRAPARRQAEVIGNLRRFQMDIDEGIIALAVLLGATALLARFLLRAGRKLDA